MLFGGVSKLVVRLLKNLGLILIAMVLLLISMIFVAFMILNGTFKALFALVCGSCRFLPLPSLKVQIFPSASKVVFPFSKCLINRKSGASYCAITLFSISTHLPVGPKHAAG